MNYLPWVGIAIAVIVVVATIRWVLSLRRVVKPSEVHVVRRGKITQIYGNVKAVTDSAGNVQQPDESAGNVYYHVPVWIPIWGVEVQVLPLHNFSIDLDSYEAYDKDKLPFIVDVTAFFRIADYRQAASRIEDNDTLEEHLMKIVQGAVRTILAQDLLEEIMTSRSKYGEQFTSEVSANLREWGIVPVKSVELMDIRDKEGEKVIANIMEKKKSAIDMESRKEVAKNKQEAETAEVEALQAVELRKEEKEEAVGKRKAERQKAVGIAEEQSKQEVQEQAKMTKEKEMEVVKVGTIRQAEIDKEKKVIDADAKKESDRIAAEAKVVVAENNKQEAEHMAQAEFVKKTKEAEAGLVAAENEAKGIQARGEAEAIAKEKAGLAEVQPQITLAKEIGENDGYQTYLIEIKKVEASQAVGVEQAKNLGNADIKIIANAGGNVSEGVSSVMDLFTAKGGQALGSMLEALAGTEAGKQLLDKVAKPSETKK
ncbi:MAG: SPFH domain-containing protein [Acetobacter sp.]|nr:SPFH domain-containing protein [Acetobacter sp.]